MPNKQGKNPTQQEQIEKLKEKFLAYYKNVPIQKYAAMYIGRSEDTIIRWKDDDKNFADSMDTLKAEYLQDTLLQVKDMPWKLERMFKQEFAQRTELTGAEGKKLTPVLVKFIDNENNRDTNRV